jgi:DeoR/GlpR family transcriptional regulator of sugar metabolism
VTATPHGRRAEILSQLSERGEVVIAALASHLGVSEMTIRRDLESLETEGLARRVRGGAISTVSRAYEPPFAVRSAKATAEKRAIGRAAAQLVGDGETAILDVGTTTLELARHLHGRRGITIVTPSIPIAVELGNESDMRILLTGGILRHGELSLIGARAEEAFGGLNCDVVFLGVAGIDRDKGLTEYNLDDTRVKRAALAAARRCVVLADSTKLGRVTFASVAPLSKVDTLVTDAEPSHPLLADLQDAGIEVIHVSLEKASSEVDIGLPDPVGRRLGQLLRPNHDRA